MPIQEWDHEKMKINVDGCRVPVIVEFFTSACVPCRALIPILDELQEEFSGRAVFGKVRADEYKGDFPISTVPTVIINTKGKVFGVFQGVVSADKLREEIEAAIDEMDQDH